MPSTAKGTAKTFLIVELLNGTDNAIITAGSETLRTLLLQKGNVALETGETPGLITAQATDNIELQEEDSWFDRTCEDVGPNGILYLRGHGNWRARMLGGRTATSIAKMLHLLPVGAIVNVVGCNTAVAGRNGQADDPLGEVSLRSFSGELHSLLKAKGTIVIARSQPVQVNADGKKVTYGSRDLPSSADLRSNDPAVRRENMIKMLDKTSKRADSKWQFGWNGEQQTFRAIY